MGSTRKKLTVPFDVFVHGYCLGVKKRKDPLKDRRLYLEIDEFEVEVRNENRLISVTIKKHHISQYKVPYCRVCLEAGKRVHGDHQSSKGDWCKDHYAEMVRRESPDQACPMCDKGHIMGGMGGNLCSHCDYTEPHVHDRPAPPPPEPMASVVFTTQAFACDCMSWDTPQQHRERRERVKRERAEKEKKEKKEKPR